MGKIQGVKARPSPEIKKRPKVSQKRSCKALASAPASFTGLVTPAGTAAPPGGDTTGAAAGGGTACRVKASVIVLTCSG